MRRPSRVVGTAAVVLLGGVLLGGCERWSSHMVSVNADGSSGGDKPSYEPVFSPDGTKVAFRTQSSNLGPTDTNECRSNFEPVVIRPCWDVYLRDLDDGTTTLVSNNAAGTDSGNHDSPGYLVFSPDGSKLLFTSRANDLTATPVIGHAISLYIYDLAGGDITLVAPGDVTGAAFSPDGGAVAFSTSAGALGPADTNNSADVYLKNLATGSYTLLSVNKTGTNGGNAGSHRPTFTPDGTRVLFGSGASDLGPNDFSISGDIYMRDLVRNRTYLVSADAARTNSGNGDTGLLAVSPDGEKVALLSHANNLGVTDTNGKADVYVRDLDTGGTWRLPTGMPTGGLSSETGLPGAAFSPDGSQLAFVSWAAGTPPSENYGTMSEVHLYDLDTEQLRTLSYGSYATTYGASFQVSFSPDGGQVAFQSSAVGVAQEPDANGASDIFVSDLDAYTLGMVSLVGDGSSSANGSSVNPVFSSDPDEPRIAFVSLASDLGTPDGNGHEDIYVADWSDPDA